MSEQLLKAIGDLSKQIDEAKAKSEGEAKKNLEQAQKDANELKENLKKLEEKQQKAHEDFVAKLTEKDATIGQIQGEVKDLKAKGGRPGGGAANVKTIFAQVADSIEEHKQKFIDMHEKKGIFEMIQLKTVANISSSNNSANYLQYLPWQPGMEPIGQDRFRDLVPTIQSSEDFVSYPRANVPIGEGSFNRQTEAAAKQQVDRDYTMITLTLKPMAGYAIVSRQSLRNIVFLQQWLPTSMLEQLMDAEDTDFANTLVAAATGSSTTTYTVKAEKIIAYIKNLRKAKHNPNAVAIDPDTWGDILVTKPNDYSLPNVVTIDQAGTVKILGRPIYAVNWLTGGRCLVGDFRKAAIVQSEGLTLRQTDSHSTTFTTNEITFLLERTEGLAIFRPDAFVTAVV
jgi:HK97 family phage major capsid protein